MKSDLDRLTKDRHLDAMIVEGADGLSDVSAPWKYLTRGQKMTGFVVKKRGEPAQIIYHPMEQLQAEASGLALVSFGRWDLKAIAKASATRLEASVEMWRQIFRDLEVSGRVAWYGATEAASTIALIDALRRALPTVEIVGEYENSVIDAARRTKDADEIAAMEDVGRRTCEVVAGVVGLIKSSKRRGNVIVDEKGWPVTIGAVKQFIRREGDTRDLEVGDPIFAQGRDAGIPHAHGEPDAPLVVGEPIVFDIYPRCRRTGYHHDMTRTFVIGEPRDELRKVYDDVKHAFDAILGEYKAGERCKKYQDRCCEIFKERGHLTVQEKWPLEEGYTHSLGHGLGLDVHEALAFSSFVDRGDTLEPGNVFALEPGLYYPSKNIGVRIEDTIVCDADGTFRSITPFGHEWVIEVRA
jgi:Xaa-Pro aminopeptidase